MDITKHIVDDHDEIRELSRKARETQDDFATFSQAVKTHSKAEEHALYKPLEKLDEFNERVKMNGREHKEVEELLNQMESLSVEDPQWEQNMKKVTDALDMHMREEETDLFPRIKDALTEEKLVDMGDNYLFQKEEVSEEVKAASDPRDLNA